MPMSIRNAGGKQNAVAMKTTANPTVGGIFSPKLKLPARTENLNARPNRVW